MPCSLLRYFFSCPPAIVRLLIFNGPTTRAATRLTVEKPVVAEAAPVLVSIEPENQPVAVPPVEAGALMASQNNRPAPERSSRVGHRMQRIQSELLASATKETREQPEPKPKKKLKLGNQIRQGLGMRLRPELNWWQRISWKLKASILVILVAVVFAILHVTILAIIFGIVGAFLLMSGLKRSFKVRRPWF